MICQSCNKPNRTGADFCGYCGAPSLQRDLGSPQNSNIIVFNDPITKRNTLLVIGAVVLAALVVFSHTASNSTDSDATATRVPLTVPKSVIKPLIDIPHLAFAPESDVERILGKPNHKKTSSNIMVWHEGKITATTYKNGAEAYYLGGRLTSITYVFPKASKPTNVGAALALAGLPREATSLGLERPIFRASIPSGNPLRCCGLTFQLVQVSEDFSDIWVNYVNINDHYKCWVPEMRAAWRNSGMPEPITTGDTRVRLGPIPPGGTILDAPFIHDCEGS